jgi:purine-cytosine permease-like protein
VANVWFYALGALILLAANVSQEPTGFVEAIMLLAGPVALLVLLVDETDEAWADLYSSAVSIQNIRPAADQRSLILGIGTLSFVVALVLDVTRYENFLLLVGSVFVPLFGVLASDFFVLRRRYDARELIERGPAGPGTDVRWAAIGAWLCGIVTFQWIAGNLSGLGVPAAPDIGASIPSFVAALLAHALLARVSEPRQLASPV